MNMEQQQKSPSRYDRTKTAEALRLEYEHSKAQMMQRIKESFHSEVMKLEKKKATDPSATQQEHQQDDVQSELRRLRKRCSKMQKSIQVKDALINSLREEKDVKVPFLLHETMRNLQLQDTSISKNNQLMNDIDVISVINSLNDNEEASISDTRVYTLEQQITALHQELHEEQQRRELLEECLREQKYAKAKLVKACKLARHEIESMKTSGMADLLDDLQSRCCELEKQCNALKETAQHERDRNLMLEQEKAQLAEEVTAARNDARLSKDTIVQKESEIARLWDRIHQQQCNFEDLQLDYKNAQAAAEANQTDESHDKQHDILLRALQDERSKARKLMEQNRALEAERDRLEVLVQQSHTSPANDATSLCHELPEVEPSTADQLETLHEQVSSLQCKLRTLVQMTRSFVETGAVDTALLGGGLICNDEMDEGNNEHHDETMLLDRLEQSLNRTVDQAATLQQIIEDALAQSFSTQCAMQ